MLKAAERRVKLVRRCDAKLTTKEYQLLCLIRNRLKRRVPAKIEVILNRGITWQETTK